MTIVGFEQKKDGSKDLIVFDPMFHDNANVLRLVDKKNFRIKSPEDMLRAYRRGVKYLKKFNEFEILRYVSSFLDEQLNLGRERGEQMRSGSANAPSRLTPPESQKGNIGKGGWDE
jgi:hypothetical protein